MPLGLKRIYGTSDLQFITCSCYRRLPLLGTARARNIFVEVLDQVRYRFVFKLVGYVVMPEHVHFLISEPTVGTPSTVMQMLKQRVSRLVREGTADGKDHSFWLTRFYDFNVRTKKKKVEKKTCVYAFESRENEDWSSNRTTGLGVVTCSIRRRERF